jgi:hypothetical protein
MTKAGFLTPCARNTFIAPDPSAIPASSAIVSFVACFIMILPFDRVMEPRTPPIEPARPEPDQNIDRRCHPAFIQRTT